VKDIISKPLADALKKLEKQVPQTKKATKKVDIDDVNPRDLPDFLAIEEVPDDCYFWTDAEDFRCANIFVCWDVDVATTEEEQMAFRRKRFKDIAWYGVRDALYAGGFKRISGCSSRFKQLNGTNLYDLFMEENWKMIEQYYSLFFAKESE